MLDKPLKKNMNPILKKKKYGKSSVHQHFVEKKDLISLEGHINHMMFKPTEQACQDINLTGEGEIAIRPITSKQSSVNKEITLIEIKLKQKLERLNISSFDSICIYRIRGEELINWEQPANYVVAYIPLAGSLRSFRRSKKTIHILLGDCMLVETGKRTTKFSCRPDKEFYLLVFTKKTT